MDPLGEKKEENELLPCVKKRRGKDTGKEGKGRCNTAKKPISIKGGEDE